MPDEFVPLARYLRAEPHDTDVSDEPFAQTAAESERETPGQAEGREEIEEAIRAARRFRAGLADAMDARLESLLREIANEVLARELELRAADVAAIVRGALVRARESVLTIRAHPRDADALEPLAMPVATDEALRRGDVTIELTSGTIEMRLEERLERVLAACLG